MLAQAFTNPFQRLALWRSALVRRIPLWAVSMAKKIRISSAPKGTAKAQGVVKSPATSSARPKAPRALKVHNSDAAVEGCLKHFKHLTQ